MARKKPTSTAMKSYFDDLDASEVFVSEVDETPDDTVVEAGVTDGADIAVVVLTVVAAGGFEAGFAEDGPAVVGELGAPPGDEAFAGTVGAVVVDGKPGVGVEEPGKDDGTTPAPAVATPPGTEAEEPPVPVTGVLALAAVAGLIEALEFVFEASC